MKTNTAWSHLHVYSKLIRLKQKIEWWFPVTLGGTGGAEGDVGQRVQSFS